MMSFRQGSKNQSIKKSSQQKRSKRKQPLNKKSALSPETKEFKLFQSAVKSQMKSKIDSQSHIKLEQGKISNKIFTTDQSNNQYESKTHESIYIGERKQPYNEYFQQPLSFKPKKLKMVSSKKQPKVSRIQNASIKLQQMKQMVKSQNQQLSLYKNQLSSREIQRLIKIHSIEKLKLIEQIGDFKSKSKAKSGRRN